MTVLWQDAEIMYADDLNKMCQEGLDADKGTPIVIDGAKTGITQSYYATDTGILYFSTDGTTWNNSIPLGSHKNVANGIAGLNSSAQVALAQIPTTLTGKNADMLDGKHYAEMKAEWEAYSSGGSLAAHAALTTSVHGIDSAGRAKLSVKKDGSTIGTRRGINFHQAGTVILTIADDSVNDEVDVTISASGGEGGGDADTLQTHPAADFSLQNHTHSLMCKINSGTYTGNNTENRAIAHGLGTIPKIIFITPDNGDDFLMSMPASDEGSINYILGLCPLFPDNSGWFGVTKTTSSNFYVGDIADYHHSGNSTGTIYNWVAMT